MDVLMHYPIFWLWGDSECIIFQSFMQFKSRLPYNETKVLGKINVMHRKKIMAVLLQDVKVLFSTFKFLETTELVAENADIDALSKRLYLEVNVEDLEELVEGYTKDLIAEKS